MSIIFIIVIILVVAAILYFIFKKPPSPPIIPEIAEGLRITMAENKISIENLIKSDSKTYEFDIFIETDNARITSYQAALGFNQNMISNGTLTFEYIVGSCEINNPPQFGLGVNSADGQYELTFGSGPGDEVITSKKRLGKFRLKNSVDFPDENLMLSWNFAGAITTIVTGENFDNITNQFLFTIIYGDIIMITITESQKVLLTAEPLSAKGNVAPIDGPVTWTILSGDEFVELIPVSDTEVEVSAIGPIGLATIEAKADADLSSGETFITATLDVEVVGGQAVTLNIITGTPTEQ